MGGGHPEERGAEKIIHHILRVAAPCQSHKHSDLSCWKCGGSLIDAKKAERVKELLDELLAAGVEQAKPVAWQYKMLRWADCSESAYKEYLQDGTPVRELFTHPLHEPQATANDERLRKKP